VYHGSTGAAATSDLLPEIKVSHAPPHFMLKESCQEMRTEFIIEDFKAAISTEELLHRQVSADFCFGKMGTLPRLAKIILFTI